MAECDFNVQDRAKLVLDLMEEVDEGDNDYPLNYYVDAAHDFENLKEASDFLFKECPIQGFCAEDKIPIHEVDIDASLRSVASRYMYTVFSPAYLRHVGRTSLQ